MQIETDLSFLEVDSSADSPQEASRRSIFLPERFSEPLPPHGRSHGSITFRRTHMKLEEGLFKEEAATGRQKLARPSLTLPSSSLPDQPAGTPQGRGVKNIGPYVTGPWHKRAVPARQTCFASDTRPFVTGCSRPVLGALQGPITKTLSLDMRHRPDQALLRMSVCWVWTGSGCESHLAPE